jgi:hypothetical protein
MMHESYSGCVWVRRVGSPETGFVMYPPRGGAAKVSWLRRGVTEAVPLDDLDERSRASLAASPRRSVDLDDGLDELLRRGIGLDDAG